MPVLWEEQIIDLYSEAHVPIPSLAILHKISLQYERAPTLLLIHEYFDAIAATYSPATETFIQNMYYAGHHVEPAPNLLSHCQAYAAVRVERFFETGNPDDLRLSVLPAVQGSDIRYRLLLIHEVASHVGQLLSRLEQVGLEQLRNEYYSFSLRRLMEWTAGLLEQPAMKVVYGELLFAPQEHHIGQPEHDAAYCHLLQRDRGQRLARYMGLQDHTNIPPSPFEHNLFLMRAGALFGQLDALSNQFDQSILISLPQREGVLVQR